jgi:TolA-binding protein
MGVHARSLCLGVAGLAACASPARQTWPGSPAAPAPPAAPSELAPAEHPKPPPGVPDSHEVTQARRLVEQGARLYRQGDYDKAEVALKEAMTLYPFLSEANLVLGKIFLIRASATRDLTMMNSARLMFEMARALDPQAREADALLQLFRPAVE